MTRVSKLSRKLLVDLCISRGFVDHSTSTKRGSRKSPKRVVIGDFLESYQVLLFSISLGSPSPTLILFLRCVLISIVLGTLFVGEV